MNLWQDLLGNVGLPIGKWAHYFPAYERHLSPFRNKDITVLEIGVAGGGSLQMWNRFFGPRAKIVGIDIDPKCKEFEHHDVSIRIGSQNDEKFLKEIIDEFGNPDIVIDDGSHRMDDVLNTFQFFYPKIPKNGVYFVEDMHTSYWPEYGGGINNPGSFINISKHFIDQLNAHWLKGGELKPDLITNETYSISFYDSLIVFEKGGVRRRMAPVVGNGFQSPV
jgi:hypothetical protein